MYDRILVPVDGSTTAKRGLEEALKIAAKLGSTVRVIHVVDDLSMTMAAGSLATNIGELQRRSMKILIPVDDSDMSRHAIELAARMGREGTAPEAILLNVREQPEIHGEIGTMPPSNARRASGSSACWPRHSSMRVVHL